MFTAEGYKVVVNFWLKPNFVEVTAQVNNIISIFDTGMNISSKMLINSSALSQLCKSTFENKCAKLGDSPFCVKL